MSEDRETQPAGSPVEETEATNTDVLAAVERAKGANGAGEASEAGADAEEPAPDEDAPVLGEAADPSRGAEEPPEDGGGSRATDNLVDVDTDADAGPATEVFSPEELEAAEEPGVAVPENRRPPITLDELPSATADDAWDAQAPPRTVVEEERPVRDGEIRISSDHPMAALYMQTPTPPDLRGNRGAGILISLVATIGFALVYAAVLSARLAPVYPPSQFLADALLPFLTSWGFIAATAAFFIGLAVLVLIVGRAGWWAYVLGGLPVGVFVWAAAIVGYAFDPTVLGGDVTTVWDPVALVRTFGITTPALGAAIVAREATVWFGAWIGWRGRRMTAKNAQLLADYDEALSEVRAKQ